MFPGFFFTNEVKSQTRGLVTALMLPGVPLRVQTLVNMNIQYTKSLLRGKEASLHIWSIRAAVTDIISELIEKTAVNARKIVL